MHQYDSIYSHSEGPWVFHQFCNPLPFRGGDYYPNGRFVFHRSTEQIPQVEQDLISQMREGKIKVFKYARAPLPEEDNVAIVVYARKKDKERVQSTLDSLGILDYEWREGNPIPDWYGYG